MWQNPHKLNDNKSEEPTEPSEWEVAQCGEVKMFNLILSTKKHKLMHQPFMCYAEG